MEGFPNYREAFCDYINMTYKDIGIISINVINVINLLEYFQYLQSNIKKHIFDKPYKQLTFYTFILI